MASSTNDEDGSVEHVVRRLVRWTTQAPRGVAYVTYESEDARRLAEAKWLDALRERGFEIGFLDLWSHRDVDEAIETLLATIQEASVPILSVTGFGPMLDAMGEDWRALNYRREQWYEPAIRQVWWVPKRFDHAFRQNAPDLYSWFLVKEPLTEAVVGTLPTPEPPPEEIRDWMEDDSDAAFRESDSAFERFQNGLLQGAEPEDLIDLVVSAARPLFAAGYGAEAQQRVKSMLDRLLVGSSGTRLVERLDNQEGACLRTTMAKSGTFLSNATGFDAARRVFVVLGEERIAKLKPALQADVVKALGNVARASSDNHAAMDLYQRARVLYRKVGNTFGEAYCLQGLGDVASAYSDLDAAGALYREALATCIKNGDAQNEANCLQRLGDVALLRSDHDTAFNFYEAARPLYNSLGDLLGEATCLARIGELSIAYDNQNAAQSLLELSLTLFRKVGSLQGEANCLQSLGDAARERSEEDLAATLYKHAAFLYGRINDHCHTGGAYLRLSILRSLPAQERQDYRQRAVEAWRSIGREDLVERYLPGFFSNALTKDQTERLKTPLGDF